MNTPTNLETPKEPLITNRLGMVEENATAICKLLSELENKLVPILSEQPPQTESPGQDREEGSAVANRLDTISRQLMSIREHIGEINKRVEV